jgi:hypothetical protein
MAVAEFVGVAKSVQGCVAWPSDLLTMLSLGAILVLMIASYTGLFLAALVQRM